MILDELVFSRVSCQDESARLGDMAVQQPYGIHLQLSRDSDFSLSHGISKATEKPGEKVACSSVFPELMFLNISSLND